MPPKKSKKKVSQNQNLEGAAQNRARASARPNSSRVLQQFIQPERMLPDRVIYFSIFKSIGVTDYWVVPNPLITRVAKRAEGDRKN